MLEELQEKKKTQEDESWLEFEEYVTSSDPAERRVDTQTTKIFQMTQSNATKTENLENDFEELSTKTGTREPGSTRHRAVCFKRPDRNDKTCQQGNKRRQ